MDDLPCEIKLAIIRHLQVDDAHKIGPHSIDFDGVRKPLAALKCLSSTNKYWRGLLRDDLFRRASIRISDDDASPDGFCTNSSDATRFRQAMKAVGASCAKCPYASRPDTRRVECLTIKIDETFMTKKALRNPAQHSTDIMTINEFWRRLFDVIDPLRMILIAPVNILGWLTTAVPEMGDEWAFPDMKMQVLELEQECHLPLPVLYSSRRAAEAWDTEYLFHARSWHSVKLMEGSMLQAYGRYEYFNKTPPSVVRGLIFPRSERLTSFSNTVLFPFSSHIDHMQLVSLAYYKRVHFHFGPSPLHRISNDDGVAKMNVLADCWREMEQIYIKMVAVNSPLFREGSQIVEFGTGDYGIDSVKEILDAAFDLHVENGWQAAGPGRWTKCL